MTRRVSGGRAGGFRKKAGYPTQTKDNDPIDPTDYFGIGGFELGGQYKDYLDQGPDLPDWLGGGSLVYSPYEAVDPRDCDRWPGSPYCGELPWGENFIGLDIGFESTECEDILSIEGTLGWWRMPPLEIGRRRCEQPPAPPPDPAPPPGSTYQLSRFRCFGRGPYTVYARLSGTSRRFANYDPFTNSYYGPETVDIPLTFPSGSGGQPGFEGYGFLRVWGPIYSRGLRLFGGGGLGSQAAAGLFCHGIALGGSGPTIDPVFEEVEGSGSESLVPDTISWEVLIPSCNPANYPRLPAPRQPPTGGPDDMACNCKALEASLKRIERVLGIPQLYSGGHSGWKVPAKLAGTNTQDTATLDNYATLLNWLIGEIRDSLGDTKYKITIEDANLVQEGDQEVSVEIPNLSEGQAEILGLLLQMSATLNANFAATNHSLIQSGEATLAATRSALEVQEIADFLGYKTQEKAVDVPLMFTPDKNDPSEFLKPSQAKITYMQVDDKNDLSIKLAVLEQAAAIIRGVFAQRADIASLVAMDAEIKEAVNDRSDVDQVMEQIEDGFTVFDLENPERNPYGKPYSQRPRIVIKSRGGWTYGQNNNGNP